MEDKILEFPQNQENLLEMFSNELGKNDIAKAVAAMLALDDEKFNTMAPIVLDNFYRSLKDPNEQVVLMAALRAQGLTVEEYTDSFTETIKMIDENLDLSESKKDFVKQILSATITAINETEGVSKRFVPVAIEFTDSRAKMPAYAHVSDSGADIYTLEDITIAPGETKLIHTGLKAAIPPGYELQVRPKSGRSLKTKLRVANTPGTIDAGYRDEICIIIENIEPPFKDIDYTFDEDGKIHINSILHGASSTIGAGEKFAQLVLMEVPKAAFYQVENVLEVENIDANRMGGFGSTDNQ